MSIYCMRCWADNDAGATRCWACGADLIEQQREDEQLDFSAKLVRALRHRTPEIPVIAAKVLGKRRDVHGLQPLMALGRLGGAEAARRLARAMNDPAEGDQITLLTPPPSGIYSEQER